MKLLVGIDVSSEKLDTCFLDSEDQILLEESLSNTISGASKIKEYILQFNDSNLYNRIIIGMEATSVYSFHPSTFLAEDRELNALNVEVVVMNPKAIHRFKGIFDEDKTDRIHVQAPEKKEGPATRMGTQAHKGVGRGKEPQSSVSGSSR